MKTPPEHFVYINCSECLNKKQFFYTARSQHVLSLEFSCTEFIIVWTVRSKIFEAIQVCIWHMSHNSFIGLLIIIILFQFLVVSIILGIILEVLIKQNCLSVNRDEEITEWHGN